MPSSRHVVGWSIVGAVAVAAIGAPVGPAEARFPNLTSTVFINELHYDNTGTDTGEAIEIAAPAGTDLTGWSIVLYNGSNGTVYDTDPLSGTVANQVDGYGTVVADVSGQRDPERGAGRHRPGQRDDGRAVPQLRGRVHRRRRAGQWPLVHRHRRGEARHRGRRPVAGADRLRPDVRELRLVGPCAVHASARSTPDSRSGRVRSPETARWPRAPERSRRRPARRPRRRCRRPIPTARWCPSGSSRHRSPVSPSLMPAMAPARCKLPPTRQPGSTTW